jgi:hypothetical protein
LSKFDYDLPAELFPTRQRKFTTTLKYRRFDHAAHAIRFAIEELPAPILLGTFIEVEESRLGHRDIRELYDSADYPLPRAQIAGTPGSGRMTAPVATHRYGLGQHVRFEPKFGFKSAPGDYEILGVLPVENDDNRRYRIKSVTENFERIAEEHRLTSAE